MAAAPCQSCLLCQREPVPGCSSQTTPGQPCAACNCGLRAFWRQSARGGQGSSTSPISTHYFVSNILLVILLYCIMACMTNMINHVFSPKENFRWGFNWNIAWIYLTPSIWNALRIGFRNEQGKYFNQGVRFDIHNWLTLFTISSRPFIFCKPMKMLRKAQLSPTIIEMYSTVNTSKNGGHNLLLVSNCFNFLDILK